jgi:hypothetical protein
VIPKDEADAKSIGESQEDMNIMAHILDKVATSPDGKSRRAMGIPVRVPFDIGGSRNLYIDGYGAIFFVNVGYPLTAPPVLSDKPETKPEAPSEWDEARRELYQPGLEAPKGDFEFKLFESDLQAAEPYDADRVEQLQKGLVESLKNASHLRCLKSHETVTVVINGRGPGAPKKVVVTRRSSSSSGNGNSNSNGGGGGGGFGSTGGQPNVAYVGRASGPAPESRGNQMLLRASKSDIEAFAGGKLSYDEFRKKVTVLNY